MDRPDPNDVARAAGALGAEPAGWRPVTRGGQTAASRWVVTMPDGATRFVKIAFTDDTASWIRDEHLFYALAGPRPYLPAFLGWHDDGNGPCWFPRPVSTEPDEPVSPGRGQHADAPTKPGPRTSGSQTSAPATLLAPATDC